ncbi:Spo0E family sporulation regulatory protein-aspartic acid phosphatase [Bacillus sp. V3B]|uniref:Spo0E family sporulation regulatory protein-aspartic acid phosphatase n=1 Tax=Bacillus sp. V3B TaxID=2804915 RepID=UPI00210EDF2F|nr:Spo0E family sporulation regulatory protein-aspartic acid phosphatase [Bacillus sp. V3B]
MEAADLFKVNNDSIRTLHSTSFAFFVSFFTWFNMTPLSMFSIEIDELEDRINQLKKELIQVALTTGLNSHDTLCCSQKLDELITIYQKLSYEKPKNRNMLLNDNKAV